MSWQLDFKSLNTQTSTSILSVFELNRSVRALFESHYDWVWVEGEISNFNAPSSGHWYFTLKDEKAQVRCAMFRNRNIRIKQIPDNGEKVRLRGKVSLYEGKGEYQLIVEHIESSGFGSHQIAFEKLKQKLFEEGLFSHEKKKLIPDYINNIGLITSLNGAVIEDILKTLKRRCPLVEVNVIPVAVQGERAVIEICDAFEKIGRWKNQGLINFDTIILARGGGSIEDLSAFNDETLARTIFSCNIPVVSAIGHEVDVSISDLVSDLRAATPTAAAELVSRDQSIWKKALNNNSIGLEKNIRSRILAIRAETEHLKKRLRHPKHLLQDQSQKTDQLEQILIKEINKVIELETLRMANLQKKLLSISPILKIVELKNTLGNSKNLLTRTTQQKLSLIKAKLSYTIKILDAINPERILARGYAILTMLDGKVVESRSDVKNGLPLIAETAIGKLHLHASHWEEKTED